MDEDYKQSDISKEVERLMDEEGYEFGEAVKEAMSKGYKDGGLMVAIQKFNQGGNVIDSRATVEDMAKAIQTSSAGTDNQKLRLLMDYGMSVDPQATPQTISSSQGKMEKLLGLQPNPNFNYMKPSGPAMIMPPMASTGFRQDPGYFGNEGFIINGKRYMSEDEAIDDMGIETYNRFMAKGGMAGGKTYHQYHDQFVPPDSESMGYANGGGVGSMMQPKRGLVNEPGGYAGRTLGDILEHGYFMRDERLAGPDDGSYDIGNIIERFSKGIELPEKMSDEDRGDMSSIKEIFERDTPLTEGIFGLSEGFTLSPITILRRYLANKELEKNNKKDGGRINFAQGGGADFMPLGYNEDKSITVEDLTVPNRVSDFAITAANALDNQTGLINSAPSIMNQGVNTIEGSLIDGDDLSSRYNVQKDFPSTIDRFSNSVAPVSPGVITDRNRGMNNIGAATEIDTFSEDFDKNYDASSDALVPGMGKKAINFKDAPVDFMMRANNPNVFDPIVNTKNFVQDGISTVTDYAKENLTPSNIATSAIGAKVGSIFGLPSVIGGLIARSLFSNKNEFQGPYDDINNDGVIDRFDKARTTFGQSKNLKEYFDRVKAIKTRKEKIAKEAAEKEAARVAAVQRSLNRGSYVDRDSYGMSKSDRAVGGGKGVAGLGASAEARGSRSAQGYSQHAKGGIVSLRQ